MRIACPHCGRLGSLKDGVAPPKRVRCPGCEKVFAPETVTLDDPGFEVIDEKVPHRGVDPFGIASFVFAVLVLMVCWIPLLNIVVIPLAALGLLLGLAGVLHAGVRQQTGYLWPVVGILLCVGGYMVAWKVNEAAAAALIETGKSLQAASDRFAADARKSIRVPNPPAPAVAQPVPSAPVPAPVEAPAATPPVVQQGPAIDFQVHVFGRQLVLRGTTNLPPGTLLVATIEPKGMAGKVGEAQFAVGSQGAFESQAIGLNDADGIGPFVCEIASVQARDAITASREISLQRPAKGSAANRPSRPTRDVGSTPKGRAFLRQKLGELDAFKGDQEFHQRGYGGNTGFSAWANTVRAGADDTQFGVADRAECHDLWMLGTEYYDNEGRENDDSRRLRSQIARVLDAGEAKRIPDDQGSIHFSDAAKGTRKAEVASQQADQQMKLAKGLETLNPRAAIERYEEVIRNFPGTTQAKDAAKRVKSLEKKP